MTIMLGGEALRDAMRVPEAIDLLEQAFARESAGGTIVSPKFATEFRSGSMRILFAADEEAGYAAMKAYHNVKGVGTRYVVSLYRLKDGELVALLDGQGITDLRTGACSGVIARKVPIPGPVSVGVIGSGVQARAQLASLASVYRLGYVAVFSPTPAHRQLFAREMSKSLDVAVIPVDSIEAAVVASRSWHVRATHATRSRCYAAPGSMNAACCARSEIRAGNTAKRISTALAMHGWSLSIRCTRSRKPANCVWPWMPAYCRKGSGQRYHKSSRAASGCPMTE
jgi:Ornithine cyclodeaminase/mu-crystallin family